MVGGFLFVVTPNNLASIGSCDGYQIFDVVNWLTRRIGCNDRPSDVKDWQSIVCEKIYRHNGGLIGEVKFT